MSNKRIILIGGAPTTGKSTLAHQVAKHFDVPWISTDQIRKIMRKVASRTEYPGLFNPKGYSTERLLNEFTPEELLEMQLRQAQVVWSVTEPFIKEDWMWTNGFVVEGVHILPDLVARDFPADPQVQAVFLFDDDIERTRNAILSRGLSGDPASYPDDLKEKEVEFVRLYGERLAAEAARLRFPCVRMKKNRDDFDAVLAAINP